MVNLTNLVKKDIGILTTHTLLRSLETLWAQMQNFYGAINTTTEILSYLITFKYIGVHTVWGWRVAVETRKRKQEIVYLYIQQVLMSVLKKDVCVSFPLLDNDSTSYKLRTERVSPHLRRIECFLRNREKCGGWPCTDRTSILYVINTNGHL